MMLAPEMIQIFDWSEMERRLHYGRLKNVYYQMVDMLFTIKQAQSKAGYLDIGVRDGVGEFWLAVTRPGMGMPDTRPASPRRDLDLVEYLIEWAAGVRNHATAELGEMDARYPELAGLGFTELMPAKMIYRRSARPNWLKRAFKSIFR